MKPTTIFLGGSWYERDRLRLIRSNLQRMGHTVNASWLDVESKAGSDSRFFTQEALTDLEDLRISNLVIIDVLGESSHGGRETEIGVAIEAQIPLWIVGQPRNVYHYLAEVIIGNWWDASQLLAPDNWEDMDGDGEDL